MDEKFYNEKMCEFYSKWGPTKCTPRYKTFKYTVHMINTTLKISCFGATITKVMTAEDGSKVIVWGEGSEERDLLYISDLGDFVKLAVEKQRDKFQLFNAGLWQFNFRKRVS